MVFAESGAAQHRYISFKLCSNVECLVVGLFMKYLCLEKLLPGHQTFIVLKLQKFSCSKLLAWLISFHLKTYHLSSVWKWIQYRLFLMKNSWSTNLFLFEMFGYFYDFNLSVSLSVHSLCTINVNRIPRNFCTI